MFFTYLRLEHFRRFVFWEHTFTPGVHLIVAPNARGKTTVLEALAFLSTFSSFLTHNARELVNQVLAQQQPQVVTRLQARWRLQAEGDEHHIEVRLVWHQDATGRVQTQKTVLVDGVKRSLAQALGQVQTVLFLPHMLHLVDAAPELRRRYLNLTIAPGDPEYAHALTQYTRALQQRNALLKQLAESGGPPSLLEPWEALMARHGAYLWWTRHRVLQEWNHLADRYGWNRLGPHETLRLVYRPGVARDEEEEERQYALWFHVPETPFPETLERVQSWLLEQLVRQRPVDLQRGHTTVGPHRDDVRFLVTGRDLALFGSRGQVRSALLMLKLVEAAWYHERTGHKPVVLLDEVLAELDPARRQRVLEAFLDFAEQLLLTTTEPELFPPALRPGVRFWRLHDTGLEPLPDPARA